MNAKTAKLIASEIDRMNAAQLTVLLQFVLQKLMHP